MRVFWARELAGYPTGRQRVRLLLVVVLASLVAGYEGNMAPVVPLLLADLDMSLQTYGLTVAAATATGSVAAAIGGRLSDAWGRVTVLVPTLMVTACCVFALLLVRSPLDLLAVRCLLSFAEGAAVTTSAGLVRDFTPRVGRATGFGLWMCGPILAAFLAAGIAAVTLPLFDDSWRSQFVIMGTVSIALTSIVAWRIADLPPRLRARAITSEAELAQVSAGAPAEVAAGAPAGVTGVPAGAPGTATAGVRGLLRHPHLWAHVLGATLWLVFFYTIAVYGPTMIQQAFGFTTAQSAMVSAAIGIVNVAALIGAGRLSDRVGVRKPFCLIGTVGAVAAIGYFVHLIGTGASLGQVILASCAISVFVSLAFCPWMALFSENVEDVAPDLQGTAWGAFGLVVRLMIVVVVILAPRVVASSGSWSTWLVVTMVCQALFVPAIFAFRGRWTPGPRPARRTVGAAGYDRPKLATTPPGEERAQR